MVILNELQASALVTDLLTEVERAMAQRDETLRTGKITAASGGTYDTNFSLILRQHKVIE